MKIFKQLSLFFLGFVSMFVLFEVLLKFGGVMLPMLKIDPDKGERYLSDKMCCSLFNYEGFGLAKTNSSGWFGKDFENNGPLDVSVAVFGNSFIAARQVFYRDNFLSIAEKKLQRINPNTHIYNFGKETMPLRESLFIKEEIDSAHNPDYFVVFINERSLGNEGRYIPYYELVKDSLLVNWDFKNFSFVKNYKKFQLLTQSSAIFLVYRVKNNLPRLWEVILDKFYSSDDIVIDKDDYSARAVDSVDVAVIKEFDKDKRVIFLLDIDPVRGNYIKSFILNAPVIDLKLTLLKLKEEQGIDPYYWKVTNQKGHWNHAAHKVIAEEFSKSLEKIIRNN